jgi:glycosylphosphatidylinositol transamidase (GPIT) subunit GPI8
MSQKSAIAPRTASCSEPLIVATPLGRSRVFLQYRHGNPVGGYYRRVARNCLRDDPMRLPGLLMLCLAERTTML